MSKPDKPRPSFSRFATSDSGRGPRPGFSAADFFSSETAVRCAVPSAKKSYHVAIVGATGAVGEELLRVLERRAFPVERLLPLCSARSCGSPVRFLGSEIPAEELNRESFKNIDLAFFSAGGNISREFAPIARDAGAVVIDN